MRFYEYNNETIIHCLVIGVGGIIINSNAEAPVHTLYTRFSVYYYNIHLIRDGTRHEHEQFIRRATLSFTFQRYPFTKTLLIFLFDIDHRDPFPQPSLRRTPHPAISYSFSARYGIFKLRRRLGLFALQCPFCDSPDYYPLTRVSCFSLSLLLCPNHLTCSFTSSFFFPPYSPAFSFLF